MGSQPTRSSSFEFGPERQRTSERRRPQRLPSPDGGRKHGGRDGIDDPDTSGKTRPRRVVRVGSACLRGATHRGRGVRLPFRRRLVRGRACHLVPPRTCAGTRGRRLRAGVRAVGGLGRARLALLVGRPRRGALGRGPSHGRPASRHPVNRTSNARSSCRALRAHSGGSGRVEHLGGLAA